MQQRKNRDRQRESKCKWKDIKHKYKRHCRIYMVFFLTIYMVVREKNKIKMSAVNFPPVHTSSRTPLQSWTKRQRKEEKWVPRLYTLSPRPLGLFLLSCPHCECSASVLMSLGPIALSQFISTWAPFFLFHLSSLTLPPTSAYPLSSPIPLVLISYERS